MKEYNLNRDGYNLNVIDGRVKGETPLLIIGSAVYYQRLFADDAFKNMSMVFIDLRGFSKPSNEDASYSLDDIVLDIEAIRESLNEPRLHLFGHSGHGFMAMAYAQKYPEHIGTLILSNLAPTNNQERQAQSIEYFEGHASPERKAQFFEDFNQMETRFAENPEIRFTIMNRLMRAQSFYDYSIDYDALWNDVYNHMPALDHLWGEAFAVFDTKSFFDNYEGDIVLILSDYDYLIGPPRLWKDLVFNRSKIHLHKFDRSGHNPMLEEADKFAKILNNYLK